MKTDCDSQNKDVTSEKMPQRKFRFALLVWPALVFTIIIFIHYTRSPDQKNPKHPEPTNSPRGKIHTIETAMDTFLLNTGQYPAALNDLILNSGLEGWVGPYLKEKQLLDPWNRPLIYDPNGMRNKKDGYDILSYGADGVPGGESDNADIYND